MIGGLVIGFLGSLHCVGMCGPLLLSLPLHRTQGWQGFGRSLLYHSGRFAAYGLLGLTFGLLGMGVHLLAYQQGVTIAVGVLMLLWALSHLVKGRWSLFSGNLLYQWLRQHLNQFVQKEGVGRHFTLGVLNGFLPCGLVYFAATSSMVLASPAESAGYMVLFGLGTAPALLAVTLSQHLLGKRFRFSFSFNRIIPVLAGVFAVLLIVRGLGLGIPFISPHVEPAQHQVEHPSGPDAEGLQIPLCR